MAPLPKEMGTALITFFTSGNVIRDYRGFSFIIAVPGLTFSITFPLGSL